MILQVEFADCVEDRSPISDSLWLTLRTTALCLTSVSLVLSWEWGMGYGDYYWGLYRGYYRDPFPHSLLRTRQLCGGTVSLAGCTSMA